MGNSNSLDKPKPIPGTPMIPVWHEASGRSPATRTPAQSGSTNTGVGYGRNNASTAGPSSPLQYASLTPSRVSSTQPNPSRGQTTWTNSLNSSTTAQDRQNNRPTSVNMNASVTSVSAAIPSAPPFDQVLDSLSWSTNVERNTSRVNAEQLSSQLSSLAQVSSRSGQHSTPVVQVYTPINASSSINTSSSVNVDSSNPSRSNNGNGIVRGRGNRVQRGFHRDNFRGRGGSSRNQFGNNDRHENAESRVGHRRGHLWNLREGGRSRGRDERQNRGRGRGNFNRVDSDADSIEAQSDREESFIRDQSVENNQRHYSDNAVRAQETNSNVSENLRGHGRGARPFNHGRWRGNVNHERTSNDNVEGQRDRQGSVQEEQNRENNQRYGGSATGAQGANSHTSDNFRGHDRGARQYSRGRWRGNNQERSSNSNVEGQGSGGRGWEGRGGWGRGRGRGNGRQRGGRGKTEVEIIVGNEPTKEENQPECPICFELLSPPIFQCFNGHLVCEDCESKIKECAICRDEMPSKKIRNRAIEATLPGSS